MDQGLSNYQALLSLVKELIKGEDLYSQDPTTQNLLKRGIRKVTSLHMESKDKQQLIRFYEQIAHGKPKQELEIYKETLGDLLKKETIQHILQLKEFNNVLADLFLEIYEKQWIEKKEANLLNLKLKSMLRQIFQKSHHKAKFNQHQDKLACIQHKMLGWITSKETQEFVEQYRRRGDQIYSLKEDCNETKQIKRLQAQYIKSQSAQLELLRERLKIYQSKHIMQANQDDFDQVDQLFIDKDPSIIQLPQQTHFNALAHIHKLAITKQVDDLVQPILCITDDSQSQTQLFVGTTITQTEEKKYDQAEIQTPIKIIAQLEVQTDDLIKKCQQIQTHSIQQLLSLQKTQLRDEFRSQTLFQGDIFLNGEIRYKQSLIRHIEERGRRTIRQTRMIYRYDPLNQVNFHRYIDGIQGLAFVVKTITGRYLAGFYSGKLIPDKVLNQFGLLICLNSDESYILLENQKNKTNRSMVYDNFYAIFGNAQLRVKSGQDFIFSNFGIMNAYFNHQGKKVNDFLGDNINREAKFEIYEFYQVLFEQ